MLIHLVKLEHDIKTVAKNIIQGNEKRKKRIKTNTASAFDNKAYAVVENALQQSCSNISCAEPRKQMQEQIYKSIVYNTPYEYIGAMCGRRQFYDYRMEFIIFVADGMGMLPGGSSEKRTE